MRTTQQDIADYLKISRLTVSKALNYASGVSEETRNLILSTAKQLGYRHISERQMQEAEVPSEQEGNVTMSDLKQICLFSNLNCTTDSYWAPVISGMVRTLTKRGYNLKLCFLDLSEDTDFEFPINFNPRTASGIIQLGNFKKHHIRRIRECGLPVVAVDTVEDAWAEGLFSDVIMGVNEEPMKVLIGHLADLGHTRIGYAGAINGQLTNKERWQGYRRGLAAAGLNVGSEDCFIGEFQEIVQKIEAEERLSHLKNFPTAVVCFNDVLAISLMRYFRAAGVKVPEMVAVAGFDNLSESLAADLTTVSVNREELGMSAAETILWRIENPERPYRVIRISGAELIVRNSTGVNSPNIALATS